MFFNGGQYRNNYARGLRTLVVILVVSESAIATRVRNALPGEDILDADCIDEGRTVIERTGPEVVCIQSPFEGGTYRDHTEFFTSIMTHPEPIPVIVLSVEEAGYRDRRFGLYDDPVCDVIDPDDMYALEKGVERARKLGNYERAVKDFYQSCVERRDTSIARRRANEKLNELLATDSVDERDVLVPRFPWSAYTSPPVCKRGN